MKKTYIKPKMTVIGIDTESILAASSYGVSEYESGRANAPSYMENSLFDDEGSGF